MSARLTLTSSMVGIGEWLVSGEEPAFPQVKLSA